MHRLFSFRSIYARFATIFISIWWFMHLLTFGVVMRIMSGSNLIWKQIPVDRPEYIFELLRVRRLTSLVFFFSALIGTLLILLAVRGIVRPIKAISRASREIAEGRFDISLPAAGRDEISQLTRDFNQMALSLKGTDILHKDFVANVSHEFKTPITAISGYAGLIRDDDLSPGQRYEYAGLIVDESRRLSFLSSNLLRLSELDSHMAQEQAVTYALDEQLRKTVLLLELQWQKKQINMELELESVSITAAEHLLQEVWLNLIGNAIKYSHPGGTIRIGLYRERQAENQLRVEVADEGPGIAADDQPRIFERFFKGDKSRAAEGNGLGLVIARKIVEMCHGRISFVSTEGQGTTFTVELPVSHL